MKSITGRNDCGCAVFGDNGGAAILLAGAEVFAGVDDRFCFLAVELDGGIERAS